ncbi:MAG: hypothetical protein AAF577_13940 [Pseudomonadota bacterium]
MPDSKIAYSVVIADLKAQRDELDRMIMKLETMSSSSAPAASGVDPNAQHHDVPAATGHNEQDNPFLGMSIVDAVKSILGRRRKAMSPVDLVEALEAGGLLLSGTNKPNTVGSVLNRRQRQVGDIVSPKRGMWGLKEWYPGRTFTKKQDEASADDREAERGLNETSEPEPHDGPPRIVPLRSFDQP